MIDVVNGTKKKMIIDPTLTGKLIGECSLLAGVSEDTEYTDANGVAAVAKGADFMAADRYEADDFTSHAYKNGYCHCLSSERTFKFYDALSCYLCQPVQPW